VPCAIPRKPESLHYKMVKKLFHFSKKDCVTSVPKRNKLSLDLTNLRQNRLSFTKVILQNAQPLNYFPVA
jgi:hypothetical protein